MEEWHEYAAMTFSTHARDQMRKRLISEAQVGRTIANPTRPTRAPLHQVASSPSASLPVETLFG